MTNRKSNVSPEMSVHSLSEETKKSFDFALESVKQLINLASAILVFTMTFVDKLGKPINLLMWLSLTGAWLLLLISILCGIISIFQMTTSLARNGRIFEPSILTKAIARPVALQMIAFLLSLAAFVIYVSYVSCLIPVAHEYQKISCVAN